jgi:hypothetical protein
LVGRVTIFGYIAQRCAFFAATVALMATSREFDRNKCSDHALSMLCHYVFPLCRNTGGPEAENAANNRMLINERHQVDFGVRRRPPGRASAERKQPQPQIQHQRHGKAPVAAAAARNHLLSQTMHVEHLCREDCEDFERTVCKEPLDFVRRQMSGGGAFD